MSYEIICDDVLTWAAEYDGPKFHAMVTDCPYELGFMNKAFDKTGISFRPETWAALAKHLHPGGFIMAFASSRGWHRLAVAIEDAGLRMHPSIFGWQVPMMLLWAQGSGFPKATRVKYNDTQLDKLAQEMYNKVWKNISSRHVNIAEKLFLRSLIEAGLLTSSSDSVASDVVDYIRQSDPSLSVSIAANDSDDRAAILESTFIVVESVTLSLEEPPTSVTTVALTLSEDGQPEQGIRIIFVPVTVLIDSCDGATMTVTVAGVQKIELGEVQLSQEMDIDALCAEALSGLRHIISSQLETILSLDTNPSMELPSVTSVIITASTVASLISSMADIIKARWSGHRYGLQAMKPALEPIIVAQKPYEGKPVDSITATGAGALNIDGGRLPAPDADMDAVQRQHADNPLQIGGAKPGDIIPKYKPGGRWPANLYLSHTPQCVRIGERRVKGTGIAVRHNIGHSTQAQIAYAQGSRDKMMTDDITYADADGLETVAAWDCVEECPVRRLGKQGGTSITGNRSARSKKAVVAGTSFLPNNHQSKEYSHDKGNCSRFYFNADWSHEIAERLATCDPVKYVAKSSRAERDQGLDGVVQLRSDLTEEKRRWVLVELEKAGVHPLL